MYAKLITPMNNKSYVLQFFNIINDDVIRCNIKFQALHFGKLFMVNPFIQCDTKDFIEIEYWSNSESYILEAAMNTCKELNIELVEIK